MAEQEIAIGQREEKKGTIENLIGDAEKLIEIGNECFVKSHFLLYGEKVTDSNKLSAIPYRLAKLLRDIHPILDMLTERGYREVGWINLEWVRDEHGSLYPKPEWLGGKRFIVNEWRGVLTGFAGFDGYALSRLSIDSMKDPHDLYLVRLSYDESSKERAKEMKEAELEQKNPEDPSIWDSLNISREPEVIIMVNSATNPTPTFEELTEHLRNVAHSGLIRFGTLTGEYQAWKIGRLDKVPPRLFKPLSIVKRREGEDCRYLKGTHHFHDPHIDLNSLDTNYGVGYEIKILDRI